MFCIVSIYTILPDVTRSKLHHGIWKQFILAAVCRFLFSRLQCHIVQKIRTTVSEELAATIQVSHIRRWQASWS